MSELFDLTGKVAIVTGAVGLLGREHSACLAEAGANVVVVDQQQAACDALAHELEVKYGQISFGMAADITDRESLSGLRDAVLSRFDRIDVLVNNAALDDKVAPGANGRDRTRFEDYPLEAFRRSLDVNVTGTFLSCQILGSPLAQRGTGSIINLASTYGLVAPDQRLYRGPDGTQQFYKSPAYPTGKAAVIGLTRFLAAYWGPSGVRVNALCPGGVFADQPRHFVEAYQSRTPLGRMAAAGDYRGALVFLASDASSYMNGAALVVDGGFTVW
ncbi:MAG TPA: SDR family oxidoreductase [Polyangiales bacterium]|jgi:NAD(P)-dependent dehydrogenase (short-subunit alcohol dehydrogenase family)|nr:SDR family oxidoreductase [Polyangiales bacterium]